MKTITLTSDFGTKDFYLSAFKGLIYSYLDDVAIVDISHETQPYDLQNAAYNLQNAWHHFPAKSIHCLRVSESQQRKGRFLVFEKDEHFFILPDNGVITLLFQKLPITIIAAQKEENSSNSKFIAKIIAHIAKTSSIVEIGEETSQYQERIAQQPILSSNYIRGIVQYIDRFGNAITNIEGDLFQNQLAQREFVLTTRMAQFKRLSASYHDVSPGEALLSCNNAGFLQICMNQGNAANLLGLRLGDIVQVDFYDN